MTREGAIRLVYSAVLVAGLSACFLQCGKPDDRPASLPIPLLEEVEPELPYTVLLVVPVQVPAGEPTPMKLVIKNVSGRRFTIPSDFAYGFMVTTRDDTPVWWAVHAEGSYRPIVMRTNQNQGNVVSGGTRAYGDVEWDQRNLICVSSAEEPGECSGAPVPPGTYLVRGLVPTRDGESDGLKTSLSGAPEMLGERGWVATGPHELVIGGPRTSCSEGIAADRDLHKEVLLDVMRRHQDWLLSIPGLSGLGVGSVREGGMKTDELGILVLVKSIIPAGQVDPRLIVPSYIEGCTVNIQVSDIVPAGDNG